ncbi:hypothetical protein LguiB_022506 [Lonicera macranthoides]
MSSDQLSGGGATAAPQLYFCYQCNRTVPITPSLTSELLCPNCNGGFLEEYNQPSNPNPNPFLSFPSPAFSSLPFFFSSSPGGADDLTDISTLFSGPTRSSTVQSPGEFNPFDFLQNYLHTIRAGGADIQFVIENNSDDPGFRLPANLGDYFVGPGLEQLIQQLAENDPNRYGTPPASKPAVEALPVIKINKELMDSDSECAVCKDSFELGEEVKQMPCKHIYHSDCIIPWLEMHNSCPVCRYELPTDDPDYENRSSGNSGNANTSAESGPAGSSGGGENAETPRRVRISLPWPFSATGSAAETSNGGAGNSGGGNNAGGSNSGSRVREEDLD